MIYTHFLKSADGTSSPLDALMMTTGTTTKPTMPMPMHWRLGGVEPDADDNPADEDDDRGHAPGLGVSEPCFFPCYRATPSSTAAATSAS